MKKQRMNIGIAGYGRMGHEVESVCLERGHRVSVIYDIENLKSMNSDSLAGTDVVIEFTVPGAAPEVIGRLLKAGKPVVSGTTGWLDRYSEMAALATGCNTSFIHSSNYSPGVYMTSKLNEQLAMYMALTEGYRVSVREIHHTAKLDAPSGTAIMLAEQIVNKGSGYTGWARTGSESDDRIPVESVRKESVPGTHHVRWISEIDALTISHEAFGRKGFAVGAVMAAEYIAVRKGVYKLEDIFGF